MTSTPRVLCVLLGSILMASTALGQDPVMRVTGTCPGTIRMEVTGATPNGIIAILIGFQTGSTRIPAGPCQGTTLGLSSRGLRVAGMARADRDGHLLSIHEARAPVCGKYLQAVDGGTCGTTNVVQID